MMYLRSLVEKNSDADLPHEMIGFATEWLMELEVAALTGAGHGEMRSACPAICISHIFRFSQSGECHDTP